MWSKKGGRGWRGGDLNITRDLSTRLSHIMSIKTCDVEGSTISLCTKQLRKALKIVAKIKTFWNCRQQLITFLDLGLRLYQKILCNVTEIGQVNLTARRTIIPLKSAVVTLQQHGANPMCMMHSNLHSWRQKSRELTGSKLNHLIIIGLFVCLFLALQPPVGQGLLIHEIPRSHTTTHNSR
jgi:hypothetical protein